MKKTAEEKEFTGTYQCKDCGHICDVSEVHLHPGSPPPSSFVVLMCSKESCRGPVKKISDKAYSPA